MSTDNQRKCCDAAHCCIHSNWQWLDWLSFIKNVWSHHCSLNHRCNSSLISNCQTLSSNQVTTAWITHLLAIHLWLTTIKFLASAVLAWNYFWCDLLVTNLVVGVRFCAAWFDPLKNNAAKNIFHSDGRWKHVHRCCVMKPEWQSSNMVCLIRLKTSFQLILLVIFCCFHQMCMHYSALNKLVN